MSIKWLSGFRHIIRNPWQIILAIVGIAIGVAVVVAVDLANQSSLKAFEMSMETVTGKATHLITGGVSNVPDTVYYKLRLNYPDIPSTPIIEKLITLTSPIKKTFTLIGVDPFTDSPFRTYLNDFKSNPAFNSLLTEPNSCLMSKKTAEFLGIKEEQFIELRLSGTIKTMKIAGLIEGNNDKSEKAISNILICDISTAQGILNIPDRISRVDLIIKDTNQLQKIKSILPTGIYLNRSQAKSDAIEQMTDSFRINLIAMSLLALIVGMFLIYNTMTFSVVQRRRYIGLMRAIGVTRKEIFTLILQEAFVIGIIGTILGLILGVILGNSLIKLVTKTINDMYFVLNVKSVELSNISLIKGLSLGIIASLLAAIPPAREATKSAPRFAMTRSVMETNLLNNIPKLVIMGSISLIIGTTILLIPLKNIYLSYLGIVPIIIGFTFFTPIFIKIAIKLITPIMGLMFGNIGKMSARGVTSHLSRTTIAISALGISVSAAIGVGTMVQSFRSTVEDWLKLRLRADIYISVPSNVARWNDGTFDNSLADSILNLQEVKDINAYREYQINDNGRIYHILAAKLVSFNFETFKEINQSREIIWKQFNSSETVVVSETFSYKNNAKIGDNIYLPTDKGKVKFKIIGIFYDYSSDLGLVMISMKNYYRYYEDKSLSGIGVFAKNNADLNLLQQKLEAFSNEKTQLIVRSNKTLLKSSIEIFDRTFIITNVLQLLAILVSFIGILSSLMALQLERSRELGVLRANGMTPRQLWLLVISQTGLMGFISGLLSLPLGNVLAYILIYIINRRSFGWSLNIKFLPEMILEALLVSVVAALLAGIYPAYKMSKTSPSLALREE